MLTLRFPTEWIAKARDAFAALADKPWLLFAILLLVNTIARPYAGITHDSRLYSVQVLNHVEGGSYADDLFFRYGSQDEYSIFSRLAAPLVTALGLPIALFLIYLISKALLIWGMMRLVQTLVPNRTAAVLALVYCMVVPIRYGGQNILNVQETFVTPRMLAIALVLIGLDLLLRGRPIWSVATLLLGAAVHPLMAFGGLLIWGAFHVWKFLGGRAFLALAALACATAGLILAYEPIGLRFFGAMDDDWRTAIMHASSFNFPSEWSRADWWCLAFQLAIAGVILWKYRQIDSDRARFVAVLTLVTLAGTIGASLAENLPYALLLQGQPYRALWILAFLHLAWAFWLFVEWAQEKSWAFQLAACGLLAYLCCFDGLTDEMLFPLFLFPLVVLGLRGLQREAHDPNWLPHSIQLSLIVGGVVWGGYKYLLLIKGHDQLAARQPELRDIVEIFLANLGPVVVIVSVALVLVRVGSGWTQRLAWGVVAGCLALQTLFFAIPETDFYADHCTQYRSDLRRINEHLHAKRDPSAPLPTVYSNLGCLDYVWLDLHSKSYFDWWQAGGFMFRREMAMEGQRRACLVAPFEVERYRKFESQLTIGDKECVGRLFKIEFDKTHMGKDDLARLCQEPGLDYVVIEQRFDGLYAVQHGRLFLYSCQDVRVALGLPHPAATTTVLAAR